MLQQYKQPIFGIHGGGNIGLGCMADIVSSSPCDYRIFATSSDKFTNELINIKHRFWLQHGKPSETTCVKNVNMIYSKNKNNIIWLYSNADILAICLTEKGLLNEAQNIVDGLIARYKANLPLLDILILMNNPRSDEMVLQIIYKAMLVKTADRDFTQRVLQKARFIPTVVDRIVSKIDKKKILLDLSSQLRMLSRQQLARVHDDAVSTDQAAFIETYLTNPQQLARAINSFNLKFNLFRAERDFVLFVPADFAKSKRFPQIKTVKNIRQFVEVKNKYMNGPHSMLAWMGGLMGLRTISEAINKPSMNVYIDNLMENEIAPILKIAYPNISHYDLKYMKNSFIKRCKADKEDTVMRVGRDPLRKLNSGERIRGVIELKQKYGLKLETPELERGIAAGILYATKCIDPTNEECKKIQEIYSKYRSYKAILCYRGPYGNGTYPGLDSHKDKKLIKNVLKRISTFEKISRSRGANVRYNKPVANNIGESS